jgi:hypothetical protein
MANNPLGAITEIANARETRLAIDTGSGTYDYYVLLKDLELQIGRTEQRDVTTDGGPLYSYGAGDNFLTGTLLYSHPEVGGTDYTNSSTAASFNELTQGDGNGGQEEIDWLLIVKDSAGTEKFFSITGVLRDYTIRKPEEGKTEVDIFIRITSDTIASAASAP